MSDANGPVTIERGKAVATVTINRPEGKNALDHATKVGLRDALNEVAHDHAVRAVVLTGTESSFCVGQDLKEHGEAIGLNPETAFDTVDAHYSPIVRTLMIMPKPVIAAVNGACFGAGLGFALACDLRVFSSGAKLGTAFTGIGLTCDSGLAGTLQRAVGDARARELLLLARPFSPEQALEWGITGFVTEPTNVVPKADALAAQLAMGPTAAYAEVKKAITDSWSMSMPEVLAAESEAQKRLGLTTDHRNAVATFIAKQSPTFIGS
ncbi:enoyl-CoA hydratase [Aeromicrobium sp. Root495]|uniref:enoyl-CoA hydratase/isomerase family protein n=1 Tax=Aeromicrobium sp. Root495 TaxID=1736550 RepID=UPI0006FE8B97|nr:enoyl-CoA hydratase-related protein [Aeromicrobium sp. Root495]KQY55721.1 enoyl-CoA hydratase [Aeromicrobium sp. Root495]